MVFSSNSFQVKKEKNGPVLAEYTENININGDIKSKGCICGNAAFFETVNCSQHGIIGGNLNISGNVDVKGELKVEKNVNLQNNLTIGGDLIVKGKTQVLADLESNDRILRLGTNINDIPTTKQDLHDCGILFGKTGIFIFLKYLFLNPTISCCCCCCGGLSG